jgi:hypothetical protein
MKEDHKHEIMLMAIAADKKEEGSDQDFQERLPQPPGHTCFNSRVFLHVNTSLYKSQLFCKVHTRRQKDKFW